MSLKQLCFSFKGRINRSLYWAYTVVTWAMILLVAAAINALEGSDFAQAIVGLLFFVKLLIMDLAITVKRLHDTNRSGACILIGSIPIIGAFYLLVVCGFIKGTEGENKHGSPTTTKLT